MQIPMQKFRQSPIFFRETSYFVWKFENFDELRLPYISIFFAETSHTFPTYQFLQRCLWDFFLFRSWDICKNLKRPGFYKLVFDTFINNTRSRQNLKNPVQPFVDITK